MSKETVEETLKQRGSVYGSYKLGVNTRAIVVETLVDKYLETRGNCMQEEISNLRIMFGDLALKLMRFAANPAYEDSLHDLQGYAKLINDAIQGRDSADN